MINATYDEDVIQEATDDPDIQHVDKPGKKVPHFYIYRKWVQTQVFRQAGITFESDGRYTHHPPGSLSYIEYWDQEENRIKNGFEYMGQRIAGLHYLYLNYCPIWNKAARKYKFPDFRAGDAEWFLAIEHDLGLGHHNNNPHRSVGHVDAKSRQTGHSLKAVVPLLYYMNFIRGSKCYLGAIEDTYAVKTLKMYLHYHDHLYEYTDLGKGWLEKTKNKYYKTGYKDVVDGQEVDKGFLSELRIVTFQDTTEKGVGGGCFEKGTRIRLANGSLANAEDIKVGDCVMGAFDKNPKKVKRLVSGTAQLYRVSQKYGNDYVVNGDHKLVLYNRDSKVKNKIVETTVKEYLNTSPAQKEVLRGIINCEPIPYEKQEVELDPYLLGAWLGDGDWSKPSIHVNLDTDKEIHNYLIDHAKSIDVGIVTTSRNRERDNYDMATVKFKNSINHDRNNPIIKGLVRYNLFYNKYIPKEFFENDVATRLKLLAGIIDTDGYYDAKKGRFQIAMMECKLIKDIETLCRSLGFKVKCHVTKNHSSSSLVKKATYSVVLSVWGSLLNDVPTLLPRKKASFTYKRNQYIDKILVTEDRIDEYYGFELEGSSLEDKCFLLEDNTVVHNCDLFIIEEAGLFPEVLDAIGYIEPACKDGDLTTGNILVFGAAGDLKNCKQYAQLCADPVKYGFAGYPNVHEQGQQDKLVAYFIPNHSCRPPHIDPDGNPDSLGAIYARDRSLASLKKKDFSKWAQKVSQVPNTIKEMFDLRGHNRFSKHIILPHLAMLRARSDSIGTRVHLYTDDLGAARYSLSVEQHMQPIIDYPYTDHNNMDGCPLIYEFPSVLPPTGLFIGSIDSYNQDDSSTDSLGALFIYKQANTLAGETGGRYLVAEYIGRPKMGKHEFYRRCCILMRIYNAKVMIENEDPEITSWFFNHGFDHLLADQPDIIRNIIGNSTVKRTKGIHAVEPLIIAAENKIQRYLEEKIGFYYNDKGETVGEKLGVTRIPSIGLLEELLSYSHDDGDNYDRERSFGWLLMYEEELYTKPIEEDYDPQVAEFLSGVFAEQDIYGKQR